MTIYTKVGGAWVQVIPLRVKVAGVWRTPRVLVKVAGVWRTVADRPSRVNQPSVNASGTTLSVSWSAPSSNGYPIIDYDVQYKRTSSSTWLDRSHSGTSRSTTITGLSSGATYEVRVRAQNALGEGSYSLSDSDMTAAPPSTPSSLTLSVSGTTISASWSLPNSNGATITGYSVQYKLSTSNTWITRSHSGTGRSTTISGLMRNRTYNVRVAGINSQGTGSYRTNNITVPATVPGVPSFTIMGNPNQSSHFLVTITSIDTGGAPVTYRVEGGFGSQLTFPFSATFAGVIGTAYNISSGGVIGNARARVRAMNSAGNGAWSGYRSFGIG